MGHLPWWHLHCARRRSLHRHHVTKGHQELGSGGQWSSAIKRSRSRRSGRRASGHSHNLYHRSVKFGSQKLEPGSGLRRWSSAVRWSRSRRSGSPPHQRPQSRLSPPLRRQQSPGAGVGTGAAEQRRYMEPEHRHRIEGTPRLPPRDRTPPPRAPRNAAGDDYGAEELENSHLLGRDAAIDTAGLYITAAAYPSDNRSWGRLWGGGAGATSSLGTDAAVAAPAATATIFTTAASISDRRSWS